MELKIYLSNLSADKKTDFAKRCLTSVGHLQNIAYGYKPCGESLAINIERESLGEVTCEALRPDVDWAYLRNSKAA